MNSHSARRPRPPASCPIMQCRSQPGGLVGLSVFDLLLPATPLSLLDVLFLPLLLLLRVPLPAALLSGLLHGLELSRHVPLAFALLGHVAPGHVLSGSEEFLRFNSERDEKHYPHGRGSPRSTRDGSHHWSAFISSLTSFLSCRSEMLRPSRASASSSSFVSVSCSPPLKASEFSS